MALTTELLNILDDNGEPLKKRLRIANNAFASNELQAVNKDNVIIEWVAKNITENNPEIETWKTLNGCLMEERLRPNDIKLHVLKTIIDKFVIEIQNNTTNAEIKEEILKCAKIILNNELFQHYFKHDTLQFCLFISTYLLNIDDINELNDILSKYETFNRCIVINGDYIECFLNNVLNTFIELIFKFNNDVLYNTCLKITQRILFGSTTTKDFINYLNSIYNNEDKVPTNIILKKLIEIYDKKEYKVVEAYKLIFKAFINAHKKDTLQIYQFLVLLVRYTGFKIDATFKLNLAKTGVKYNIKLSIQIIFEILEIVNKDNLTLTDPINNVVFSQFCTDLLTSIIRLYPESNLHTCKLIKTLVVIDPVIITSSIQEVLMYLIHLKDAETQKFYSAVMSRIFEMYLKLHRLHKFVHEFLQTYHDGLSSKFDEKPPTFTFFNKVNAVPDDLVTNINDIFTPHVRNYFQRCIILQTNKQVVNIMRTLIAKLSEIADGLLQYTDDKKILYVEIASALTYEFFCAVRIAEHTTNELTAQKYYKDISELQNVLKKFGSTLLQMEHNQNLMYSFLNLCYIYGENATTINYYAPDISTIIAHNSIDNTPSNLTYLHSYLTATQWSLVSQRIKNFGEQPCKRILQKLVLQKLRAAYMFEEMVDKTLEASIITNYAANLETCWDVILTERVICFNFIRQMDNENVIKLAELIITEVLTKNKFEILTDQRIGDNKDIVRTILYVCLSRINNLFKKKRRVSGDVNAEKALPTIIFENIDEGIFMRDNDIDINKILELLENPTSTKINIDEDRFITIMKIIQHLPVYSTSNEAQTTLFVFLLAICLQQTQKTCVELCHKYLIGLIENTTSTNILMYEKSYILLKTLIEKTEPNKELINYSVNKCLKLNPTIASYKPCLDLVLDNISEDTYFDVAVVTFHAINKTLKTRLTEANKPIIREYKERVCECLYNSVVNRVHVEAYYLVLQNHLILKTEGNKMRELYTVMSTYVDYILKNMKESNAKGCLLLYELILTNKAVIKDGFKTMPSNYILSAWKICRNLKKSEDYAVNYDRTVTLLFEHISIEQFHTVLEDILLPVNTYLKNNELDKLKNIFNIWRNVISSALNTVKVKLTHNALQTMLAEVMLHIINNNVSAEFIQEFVKLQINIMENKQLPQLSNTIDLYLETAQAIITKKYVTQDEFTQAFDTSFQILETFLKHRKILIIDRLPAYLVHLRNFIYRLSKRSNSEISLTRPQILKVADCAFRIEQVIKNICAMKRDMQRVAPYLIADFLKHYERITLYPEVKNHFNNCLNYLINLCDTHSVTFLMRALTPASRELFKNAYDNYKKYFKFTGKV